MRRLLIEQILPRAVRGTRSLRSRLSWEARAGGMPARETETILSSVPSELLNARCFRDPLTDLWRYKSGHEFTLNSTNQLLWGTHMWPPVATLFVALMCASQRLTADKHSQYFATPSGSD